MAADLIYAFRVMRLPLLDAGGAPIGRIEDIPGSQIPEVYHWLEELGLAPPPR